MRRLWKKILSGIGFVVSGLFWFFRRFIEDKFFGWFGNKAEGLIMGMDRDYIAPLIEFGPPLILFLLSGYCFYSASKENGSPITIIPLNSIDYTPYDLLNEFRLDEVADFLAGDDFIGKETWLRAFDDAIKSGDLELTPNSHNNPLTRSGPLNSLKATRESWVRYFNKIGQKSPLFFPEQRK